ncbi:MAG: DUF1549 domain-containing protein, partial [Verrucomicrobiota bacterium]|nr:DUF1549 domain-containing protein [Verrucomicrobiota bacterium]
MNSVCKHRTQRYVFAITMAIWYAKCKWVAANCLGMAVMLLLAVCSWEGTGLASEAHWAYQVPVRPKLPRLAKPHSVANPVDQFILHHLAKRGIASSAFAKPERQARRVFLDLIGRPPQPSEAATFLVNPSQREYERMV